ncbi:MAG: hypothetical protein QW734_11605 [Candidatus Bathyarchaeia archaeon]
MSAEAGESIPGIEQYLLYGPMPDLRKQTRKQLMLECEMWRRIWQWVPDEVKYYVARTGKLVGVTQRNYKRYLGVLLETHWELKSFDLGVTDKVYDTVTGKWYYEKKIIRCNVGGIVDWQWIEERREEKEMEGVPPPPEEIKPPEELNGEESRGGELL